MTQCKTVICSHFVNVTSFLKSLKLLTFILHIIPSMFVINNISKSMIQIDFESQICREVVVCYYVCCVIDLIYATLDYLM